MGAHPALNSSPLIVSPSHCLKVFMNAPHIAKSLSRRRFLRSAGVTLALPMLE